MTMCLYQSVKTTNLLINRVARNSEHLSGYMLIVKLLEALSETTHVYTTTDFASL